MARRAAGLTTPRSVTLPKETCHDLGTRAVLDRIVTTLGLPLFVKPTRGGSALGADTGERRRRPAQRDDRLFRP